ncbi:glutaredoxin family protein [Corynebacterium tuscaniense]|uniref:Glutaredoxin family protein n=1 Tax=Corynebacterium tuscaniense TaxID=302449 RepID=A0A2N6T3P3_9CORY|nr:glutaredoxin family protein [Corynebacterium tuscaniense]KAA8743863.1 glutaredoxin family protein [Corynebacterium tuscaniense]KGF21811.1 glutaredoxin [Corynebacterium tuscaniense DNF00037]PMC63968.1 glutaredoxin family protein [Corynebacterium tuscaniense]
MVLVELMVRATCGSCERVAAQIEPVVADAGAQLVLIDVDGDPQLATEFGDRVPVVVIDGEEFACWEVDNAELAAALQG